MPIQIGGHSDRAGRLRDLLTSRGRSDQGRFAFEGPTLLDEALKSGVEILEIYATERALQAHPIVARMDAGGTDVFLMDERIAAKTSDLETPTGLISVAKTRFASLGEIFSGRLTLILADLNDPGNAGTLLRSAEAFGATSLVFGRFGIDPYHPKVVRGSMGAIFRLPLAVATADEVQNAAATPGPLVLGLTADGDPIRPADFAGPVALVVGHERHGLGAWETLCARRIAIPMPGKAESLNAAIAGSIALYEASRCR